jgi:NAD(P)-dependent dehydrogenase (short-subunit alcohol dehydrogenase family)
MPTAGQHVVIVGGSSGLGLEIAKASAALGARVTVTSRQLDRARRACVDVGASATGGCCDLTDFDSIKAFLDPIDVIDHLVLSALDRDFNNIKDFRVADSVRTATMKNVGYAAAVHYALPKFSSDASVVMFSGLSMWRPMPGSTTISMANAGVIGLVNSLAVQIAPVRVNAITPGVVAGTDAVDDADDVRRDAFEALRKRTPGHRLPRPEHIVAAAFTLMDNAGINGENLTVDAGMHLV